MTKSNNQKTIVGSINPDILSFTVGKDPVLDLELVEWDCYGTAAHVETLAQMRYKPAIISKAEVVKIKRGLLAIIELAKQSKFNITENDQDVHLAVERTLCENLGELGKRVHTGRSRNDQVAIDIRLHARDNLFHIFLETVVLIKALLKFAKRHNLVPMVGRTHLQPAMPSSVGLWASGYAEMLLDDLIIIESALKFNDRSPLGSAAGYGVPLPLDRKLTARLLGFSAPIHNVFYASNARGKLESVILNSVAQIMITLSRLAEDLIIFSMPEFGYFILPPELCTGSSIMPQKYNPDALELIRAKTARVIGQANAAAGIIKALAGGYNRDLQETKELYLEGISTTRTSLRIMKLMAESLKINLEGLRAGFIPGVFATDKALELVAGGLPFRDAYQNVRDNLAALENESPEAAVAAKTNWGSSSGLDYNHLFSRVNEQLKTTKFKQRQISACLARLMKI